ncbi:MAG: hypothetical protein GXO23_01505 [Crenarchaeota archaeon]|nr:hypothetical protein [Thermoproteota archaeon]
MARNYVAIGVIVAIVVFVVALIYLTCSIQGSFLRKGGNATEKLAGMLTSFAYSLNGSLINYSYLGSEMYLNMISRNLTYHIRASLSVRNGSFMRYVTPKESIYYASAKEVTIRAYIISGNRTITASLLMHDVSSLIEIEEGKIARLCMKGSVYVTGPENISLKLNGCYITRYLDNPYLTALFIEKMLLKIPRKSYENILEQLLKNSRYLGEKNVRNYICMMFRVNNTIDLKKIINTVASNIKSLAILKRYSMRKVHFRSSICIINKLPVIANVSVSSDDRKTIIRLSYEIENARVRTLRDPLEVARSFDNLRIIEWRWVNNTDIASLVPLSYLAVGNPLTFYMTLMISLHLS